MKAQEIANRTPSNTEKPPAIWEPASDPQRAALESEADVVFYGGAAGGGKTDLLLGAALTEHTRSVIYRKEIAEHSGNLDRMAEILGTRTGWNGQFKTWHMSGGRKITFDGVSRPGAEEKKRGIPHDLKGFDEVTELAEAVFRFLNGWKRTTIPGQRTRTIATFNPPTTPEAQWIIRYCAPWLDPSYISPWETEPTPAESGEIRYFAMLDGKEVEVKTGDPFEYTDEKGRTETIHPESRTFIRARLEDNPYLTRDDNYKRTLQALPEPLRSMLLHGHTPDGMEDHPWQVIPSQWVDIAMQRWKMTAKPEIPMSALGVDCARDGKDRTVITPRWGNWFGEQSSYPGKQTPDGPSAAAIIYKHVLNDAPVQIDVIGIGSAVYDSCKDSMNAIPLNSAQAASGTDRSGKLKFYNKRAKWWWLFRENLDPINGAQFAIFPDPKLKEELCAVRWKLSPRGIQIELKEDIIDRLGYSPDKSESLIYSTADIGISGYTESQAIFLGLSGNSNAALDYVSDSVAQDADLENWSNGGYSAGGGDYFEG